MPTKPSKPRNPRKPRKPDQLRPITIQRRFPTGAPGSVIFCAGETRILITASIETELPKWMKDADPPQGWVTAEYNMLPGSTPQRKKRGPDSRATEIQRLIARVLRAAVDVTRMPGLLITCDCEVLKADGGTRTAAITGAYIALADAIAHATQTGLLTRNPLRGPVAAVSVGIVDGKPCLDLDYALDSRADLDMNIAMDHKGRLIEIQGTAERAAFSRKQLDALLDLATGGIRKLIAAQRKALKD